MYRLFLLLCLIFMSSFIYAESDELISFSNGSIADADDVNHNFDLLARKLEKLKSRSKDIEVDCTNDPTALRTAYQNNYEITDLEFIIKGECYGSYNTSVQVKFQEVTIRGAEDGATLIPDENGNINLSASFGGGMHISDLNIKVPSEYPRYVLLFSRNAYGTVNNVNITGGSTFSGIIRSQRSANVYIINTTINTNRHAIVSENGASVVFYQGNSITSSVGDALHLATGSTMTALTDLSTSGQIQLGPGSSFSNIGILKFNRFHSDGASFSVREAFFTGAEEGRASDHIRLNNSKGSFYFSNEKENLIDSMQIIIAASKINLSDEELDSNEPLTIGRIRIERGSSLWIRGLINFSEMQANNSFIRFESVLNPPSDSIKYYLINTHVTVHGDPTESIEQLSVFRCRGISVLDYYGKSLSNINTDCRGNDDW